MEAAFARLSVLPCRALLCAGYARLLVGALRERTSFLKPLQLEKQHNGKLAQFKEQSPAPGR